MTTQTTQVLDDEDQMAAALQEIRNERSDAPEAAPVEAAPTEPVAEAPESAPTSTDQPTEVAAAGEEAPAAQPDPAEQLKQIQTELQKARSEIGRVNALNAKYNQAAQEVAQLREELARAKQTPQPQGEPSATAAKLAAVAEQVKDFPELAGIVSAVSEALQEAERKAEEAARKTAAQVVQPLEPLRREVESRTQQEHKAAYDAALATFQETYPTAGEVVKSAEFNSWLAAQPGHIQYAFAKGKTPQEAITVMDAYDMHLRRNGLQPIAQIKNSQPAAPAQVPQQNRLQRAAGLPTRSMGVQGSIPPADDFDGALAYFRQQRLAKAARAAA